METKILINKIPFFLWSYRHKDAKIEGSACQTIVDGNIVENRLVCASKWEIYLLKYLIAFVVLLSFGWSLNSYGGVALIGSGALFLVYLEFVEYRGNKRFLIFTISTSLMLLVVGLFFGVFAYASLVIQYTIGLLLFYHIAKMIETNEWRHYYKVSGRVGLYVYIIQTKPSRAYKTETNAGIAALAVIAIGLLASGYNFYKYRQQKQTQTAAYIALQNRMKAQPIISNKQNNTPKQQKTIEEQEVDKLLGLSR